MFGNISVLPHFSSLRSGELVRALCGHWMEIALVDYCFKVLISVFSSARVYGVLLNMLLKTAGSNLKFPITGKLKVRFSGRL